MSKEKKYPIMGYAPGRYFCKCLICDESFQGDKRAYNCEPCAVKAQADWDALTEDQQNERVARNVELFNQLISERDKPTTNGQ